MLIIFFASLSMSYCNFPSLILLSIVMISFCIFYTRLFLKRKGLSDARVVSISKKEYGFAVLFFIKMHKVLKVNK